MSLFMTVEMLIQSLAAMTVMSSTRTGGAARFIASTSSWSQRQFASLFGIVRWPPDLIALTKLYVMLLAAFAAFVGLMVAPAPVDPILGAVAIFAIATVDVRVVPPKCAGLEYINYTI